MVWSKLVNILVTLDTNKSRFVIYSQVIQLFEIIEYIPTQENEYGYCLFFLPVKTIMVMIVPSLLLRESSKKTVNNYT
jgi:hypothetical protein